MKNLLQWLFVEPRHFWLAAGVPLVGLFICVSFPQSERVIRLTGLALQLLGILTVAWGIFKTWQFFELGDPLVPVKEWLKRFPLRKRTSIAAVGAAVERGDAAFMRGYSLASAPEGASVEERMASLEKNISLIHERITSTQNDLDSNIRALRDEVKGTNEALVREAHSLKDRVASLGTGSLHISAIGAVWLFVGSILGTASQELLGWLR
jgi:hypothetical protein